MYASKSKFCLFHPDLTDNSYRSFVIDLNYHIPCSSELARHKADISLYPSHVVNNIDLARLVWPRSFYQIANKFLDSDALHLSPLL